MLVSSSRALSAESNYTLVAPPSLHFQRPADIQALFQVKNLNVEHIVFHVFCSTNTITRSFHVLQLSLYSEKQQLLFERAFQS